MSQAHIGLDDEIVIKTTLRKLLRMQRERPGDVEVALFDGATRTGIRWRVAVQMDSRDFQLAQATFNLTE